MPRGGHGKTGPLAHDSQKRSLHGGRERQHHKQKGDPGVPMVGCDPPPGLSKSEQAFWRYYAQQLKAEKRLTLKSRDTLAKYCTALAVVSDLRRQLWSKKRDDIAQRAAVRKELRQYLLASRLYENDLILNPSSSVRAPRPETGIDDPATPDDPFAQFDMAVEGDEDDGASIN